MTTTAKLNALHYAGTDWMLAEDDVSPELGEALRVCCPPGQDALPYVEDLMSRFAVTGSREDCKAMLRGYGAWDEVELADHETNLQRLVWLTGCALCEGEEAYFSTYS